MAKKRRNKCSFAKRVLTLVKKIPAGKVTTYKILARAAGRPGASRAVGNALNKNKDLFKTPCHRVIKSDSSVGGYVLGVKRKVEILKKEGIDVKNNKVKSYKKILFKY